MTWVGSVLTRPNTTSSKFEVVTHASNGRPKRADDYRLHLMVEPGKRAAGETGRYIRVKFFVQMKDGPEASIPPLAGWSYEFSMQMFYDEGLDAQGLMWGIPHDKFEDLICDNRWRN